MGNGEVISVKIDLSQADQANEVVKKAINSFGKIDILINCAGAARAGAFLDLSDQDFVDAWTLKNTGLHSNGESSFTTHDCK